MRIFSLSLLVLLGVLVEDASAQRKIRFRQDKASGESYRFFAGYWATSFHGRIRVGDAHENPTSVNVKRDLNLGLDDIGLPSFHFTYKDASSFLKVRYFYGEGQGKQIASRDFNYDGLQYVQGALTVSSLRMHAVNATVGYNIWSDNETDLAIFGGMWYLNYNSKISQVEVGSKKNRADAYMPTIGARLDWRPFNDFGTYAEFAWLQYSIGSKRIVADHMDWSAGMYYDITDYLSIQAEYVDFRNHLDGRSEEYDIGIRGPSFGLVLRF